MVENSSREKQNLESSPLPSGDPSEQLVRHFLIETGPKGVKIKGCPSEPYFGEKQGWEGCTWPSREAKRCQEGGGGLEVSLGTSRAHLPLPCRQPVSPGLPALHLTTFPALLPAYSQQRWVSGHPSSPFSPPIGAKGRISSPGSLSACLPLGRQRAPSPPGTAAPC